MKRLKENMFKCCIFINGKMFIKEVEFLSFCDILQENGDSHPPKQYNTNGFAFSSAGSGKIILYMIISYLYDILRT